MSVTLLVMCVAGVASVAGMDRTTQELLTPMNKYGEFCGYESCPRPKPGLLNVHLVPHSHGEVGRTRTFHEHYSGYTDLERQSVRNMKRIFDLVISELWADEQRTFAVGDVAHFFQWWSGRDETVRRMVYHLIRGGRLSFVGGGWSLAEEASVSYHALIDQFTYSLRKLNATFLSCARPAVSWQVDSYGHSREVASLLAQMAFDGHFINPISFEDELARMADQRLEMLWRGSDDLGLESDIFTHKLFDGYWSPPGFCFGSFCNGSRIVTSNSLISNYQERAAAFLESVQQRQGPHYATNHVLVIMGKRFAYHDANAWFANIDALMDAVNVAGYRKVWAFYSTPACYVKAVNEASPKLPIQQKDLLPIHIDRTSACSGAFSSRPTIKYMAREGHVYSQMFKQLPVLARMTMDSKLYESINWIMGLIQDHGVLSGAMEEHVARYYTKKMHAAVEGTITTIAQAVNKLRRSPYRTRLARCALNASSCELLHGTGHIIVVYNPVGWAVTAPVRLPVTGTRPHHIILTPNLTKQEYVIVKIPAPVLKIPGRGSIVTQDHELVFMATIPPLGYRAYYMQLPERTVPRRSIKIIKKKRKSKKYFIRQVNNITIDTKYEPKPNEELQTTQTDIGDEATTNLDVNDYDTTEESLQIPAEEVTLAPEPNDERAYVTSKDNFIRNQHITIELDDARQITAIRLSNGVTVPLKIQMMFYASDDPAKFNRKADFLSDPIEVHDRPPSPHILRSMNEEPELIKDRIQVEVLKTGVVEEVHVSVSDYASYAVRLYGDEPVVEVHWLVGPVPIEDDIGKDMIIRYETDLKNDGVFYTDSNGRQTMKRIRSLRDTELRYRFPTSYVAGNYYPVTSKIHIEDLERNLRFAIFIDRAQGGTSLTDGQIDLMVHRRILTNMIPYKLILNETEHGQGVTVRGKHYIYISKVTHKQHKIFEKKLAKEIELSPQILVTHSNPYSKHTKDIWKHGRNEFSGLASKLPIGVHLLTLQEWNDNLLLIRLENYLEKADAVKSGVKVVYLENLLKNITIKEVKETTLDGSKWLEEWTPMVWEKREDFYESFNEAYGAGDGRRARGERLRPLMRVTNTTLAVRLMPQQIRTFVCRFSYY